LNAPITTPQAAETARPVVRLDAVSKRFGAAAALDGVTFSVRRGEALRLIGRSGAGESTLIRRLNGLNVPTRAPSRTTGGR
jgi:ABC-type sugar transport system ATPase subunit